MKQARPAPNMNGNSPANVSTRAFKLTELLDARNKAHTDYLRAQNDLDAYTAALLIEAREAQADGAGLPLQPRPRLPDRVKGFLPPRQPQRID